MNSPKVLIAGLGVVVLWASAFPAIRVAAPELGAVGLSFVRLLVAAIALLSLAPFLNVRPPRRRDLLLIVVTAFFGMTAYQLLLNTGELSVPAGTSSIIVAGAPLVSTAIAVVAFRERLSVIRVVGSIVGSMVVQGIYHPLSRILLRRYTPVEVAAFAIIAGTIMTIPFVPLGWQGITSASGGRLACRDLPWAPAVIARIRKNHKTTQER